MAATDAGETHGGGGKESRTPVPESPEQLWGRGSALIVFSAHWQVDEGEDVKLYHNREAQEDGVENQHIDSQLPVKSPFVQVDAKDLGGQSATTGLGDRGTQKAFYLGNKL